MAKTTLFLSGPLIRRFSGLSQTAKDLLFVDGRSLGLDFEILNPGGPKSDPHNGRDLKDLNKQEWLKEAIQAAELMHRQGIPLSSKEAYELLKECRVKKDLNCCRRVQSLMIHDGLNSIELLANHLIRRFTACGSLVDANQAFSKIVRPSQYTWNAIISAHAKLDHRELVFQLYDRLLLSGIGGDKYIYATVLQVCAVTENLKQGRRIYKHFCESGIEMDVALGNALVDMYAKCGSLDEARKIFDNLPNRDAVSWSALIAGYAQNDKGLLALECFDRMQKEGIQPDKVAFSIILKACGTIGAIKQGKSIHEQLSKIGLQFDSVLGNTLVEMYAQFGRLDEALRIFGNLPKRDVVSYGAIISGHTQDGNVRLASQCFQNMQAEGIKPNEVIFTNMLTACSHAGLVEEGCKYLKSMREDHRIIPNIQHYNCMADLLGRTGYLCEAANLLQAIQPDVVSWRSLLAACKTYGSIEMGRHCFVRIVQLSPCDGSAYMLMSGIYSEACMWSDAVRIDELRQCAGAWKKPAMAWIEIDNKVHEFFVKDRSHPRSEEIYATLKRLSTQMKESGYFPKLDMVLQKISDEKKEEAICGHCEKMAIAFGLVSTAPGTTIRVTKNLRMCIDCHSATKAISKVERREIIIKDDYRMHHFTDGSCSCRDFY